MNPALKALLAAKKAELDAKASRGGTSAKFWRPSAGANRIRIMPAWTDEGFHAHAFFRQVGQHWSVSESQRGPVLCPRETPDLSGPAPISEFCDKLLADKSNPRAQDVYKEIRAKTTYLMTVIDLDDPTYTKADVKEYAQARPDSDVPFQVGDTKFQIYAAPGGVFGDLVEWMDVNELDVTDPDSGHDVVIHKTGKGMTGTRYKVTPIAKPCSSPDFDRDKLPRLNEVGYVMSENEMLALLQSGVGSEFPKYLPKEQGAPLLSADLDEDDDEDLEAEMRAALAD
jgi:hypothetical protein